MSTLPTNASNVSDALRQANINPDIWAEVQRADVEDTLAAFRGEFYCLPDRLYLDGNSLGLLCKPAERALLNALDEWKRCAIAGWTDAAPPWFTWAEELAVLTAPLVGADPRSVIVTNSTTVNLHQLLATLYDPDAPRQTILADALNFPSDLYALQSHLRLRGLDPQTRLRLVPSGDGLTLDEDAIIAHMTPDVQMAVLPAVLYVSGQWLNVERLTREAHKRNIVIGWDCSHSIGAVPHHFDAHNVDFAFWCSYKYLNGGPGATGGLYLNRRHWERAPGLAGWWSSAKTAQFDMSPDLMQAEGAGALQIGTPNIFSMAPLQGALELIAAAGMDRMRAKSLRLTDFLIRLADTELAGFGVRVGTPREPHRRGGHIALRHPDAERLCKALRAAGIVPDFRPPDVLRFAPVALYTTFQECALAIATLKTLLRERRHETLSGERALVT